MNFVDSCGFWLLLLFHTRTFVFSSTKMYLCVSLTMKLLFTVVQLCLSHWPLYRKTEPILRYLEYQIPTVKYQNYGSVQYNSWTVWTVFLLSVVFSYLWPTHKITLNWMNLHRLCKMLTSKTTQYAETKLLFCWYRPVKVVYYGFNLQLTCIRNETGCI